jgi:enoyl-CoA hydratase/carnithine racemase
MRNAIDRDMWRALPPVLGTLADDDRVRVVVLRGAGDLPFASGADIAEFETVRADAAGGRPTRRRARPPSGPSPIARSRSWR